MKIKSELQNLQETDIYSLMLFALYKMSGDPTQAALSQLAYILDKDNLLKLCEFFGGMTLRIPTIEELETLIYSLLIYQRVDIEKEDYNNVVEDIKKKSINGKSAVKQYENVKTLLSHYNFNSGRT